MTEVIEQRLKTTLIRRRAKKEEEKPPQEPEGLASAVVPPSAPTPSAEERAAPAPTVSKEGGPAKTEGTAPPAKEAPVVIPKDFAEKFKKAPRRKLTKEEMEMEDIKRAGGLKHFAVAELAPEAGGERERVFKPVPRRKKPVRREFKKTTMTETKASKRVLRIAEGISVSALSQEIGVKTSEIIKKLMALGVMATANQTVDVDTASIIVQEYGYTVEHVAFKEESVFEEAKKARGGRIAGRPPVVTVMGHVDHGKTSVLDYIRKTSVAAKEAGGITQHIGAYTVTTPKGLITFIDTPGHAAFTAMRARGARATDIVILVVAADDGVMPQTKEAIDHARAAKVPMIVAINKIDKPEANVERTKRSLSEYNVIPEEWGGDTICVNTSARTGEGIEHLLEMVLLQSEVMELKSDEAAAARGVVIEARLSKERGPVATVLVQQGTLKAGTAVVCGLYHGRIRALFNYLGESVPFAGPSIPVEIVGLSGVPEAGDELYEVTDDKLARVVSKARIEKTRASELVGRAARVTLEDLHKRVSFGGTSELGIVLKTDVHGSVEAVGEALKQLSTEKIKVNIVHAGVGGVTESDVMLAAASNAIIVGFNVVPGVEASEIAKREKIEIRRYSIIYELVDDVKKAMEGLLAPLYVEKVVGHAEVRQVFNISKVGTIAGSFVTDGKVPRTAKVRLIRDSVVITDAKIASLKRFKDDVKEALESYECGIGLERFNDIKVGDVIEAYIIEEVAQKL